MKDGLIHGPYPNWKWVVWLCNLLLTCLRLLISSSNWWIVLQQIEIIMESLIQIIINSIKVIPNPPSPQKNVHNFSFWNDQQSFYPHHFHTIILLVLFSVCQISIHCFIIKLQYNLMTLNYALYHILHYIIILRSSWMRTDFSIHILLVSMFKIKISYNLFWYIYNIKHYLIGTKIGNK